MASMLSFGTRMFRTRNPGRDANTDLDRFMTVRRSIVAAIDSATREMQGLQQRVDVYYAQANSLLDQSAGFGIRTDSEEDAIQEAEQNAAAATQRVKQISQHLDQLSDMLTSLDATLNPAPN